MSDTDKYHPDKTPVFGLYELEGPDTSLAKTGGHKIVDMHEPGQVEVAGPSIMLHDRLSGVRVVTDKFPVEIGNGRHFSMALRGPGPDGLYARIEQDAGGLAIDCCHQRVFMAVDMVEAPRHRLIGPASIQLGDHLLSFDFSDQQPANPRKTRPRWAILIVALFLALGLFLLRFLLVADEAETRVKVVQSENQLAQTNLVGDSSLPDDQSQALAPVAASPAGPDAEISEPAQEQIANAPPREDEPKAFRPAPLSVFFSTTQALPVLTESESANGSPEPAVQAMSEPVTGDPKSRTPEDPSVSLTIVERYQRGEPVMVTNASPALKQALAAIRDFYDSENLNAQMRAWDNLEAAEKQLELDRPSARREQIRAALGETLSKAAVEQSMLDNARLAYVFYYQAAVLGHENVQGRQLMATLDDKAARLFRFGYRLRYTDPSTAGQYWDRVMNEVPSQSEWYRKAELALNESKGVRG